MIIKQEDEEGSSDYAQLESIHTVKSEPSSVDSISIKEEVLSPKQSTTIEQKLKTVETTTGVLTFAPNTKIEALDFNQEWTPAKIVEVDYQENEVLVHFENHSSQYDEWIGMNSSTLRAFREEPKIEEKKKPPAEKFSVGERVMAAWCDSRKFPASINKKLDSSKFIIF